MQQVKKQLQDAIKKLKSEWGINEVKREDLAAVLEKVVAALDRAAQLPVAPVPEKSNFDKYFFRVIVAGFGAIIKEGDQARGSCYPAVRVIQTGPMKASKGFFDPISKTFYNRDSNGNEFDTLAQGRMLFNRKVFFRLDNSGIAYGVHGQGLGGSNETTDDLDDPNWEF